MIYKIQTSPYIHASILLPASKSISNRVLILNALSKSLYPVGNLSDSDDTKVLLKALTSSGPDFDIEAAGTSMRFLTAYLSQREGEWTITGTERMKNRPVRILVDALRELGAEINYLEKEGFPPLSIRGKSLTGGSVSLNGEVSSQYISALMMIAPCLRDGLKLHLKGNIISKPYIQMTLRLMEAFEIQTIWKKRTIQIQPQSYRANPFSVESDWSAASYWYEITALAGENSSVDLSGLEKNSMQGDAEGQNLFVPFGIRTVFTDKGVVLSKVADADLSRSPLTHNFIHEPDLAQTVIVTCCLLNIPFRFSGLQSLRIKETDRILALQTEMRKLGYVINDKSGNLMEWTGERCVAEKNPVISTYEDHRMAMAFAPACLKTKEIRINHPQVVAKSYPNYWKDLSSAGFIITEEK
ncbi:MAG: 3-phosphoshikimate 1-carboxyvinyltransferase [Dysgonamonadaceae bacterium]|jgi:3-phosphoshikimate 1-carboxyvinyltransferase|nr:3-phosphoshikimate 1-carboxyvinyltransferase [Dysgonamonadaceae bacterium]